MGDALALGLTSFHCPIYTDWQSNSNLTNSVDSIHSNANSTVGTGTGRGIVNSSSQEFTMDTLTKQAIINHPNYASLFSGIGHFRHNPVHIIMRQNATPVQKPPRRVQIAMKDKFKQELDAMKAQGIISKYDGHNVSPEWLNSFVIVKEPNDSLRICLDLTDLKKAIIRPVCNSQTMDDVIHKLKHAKYFTVFNTSKGFFHIPLDQESKLLTVIAYMYTTSYGTPYEEFKTNVLAFLDCCVQDDIHLNPDKVKIDCHKVTFFFCQKMDSVLIPRK